MEETNTPKQKWFLKWWSVIILLAVLGPFGFPFLWKSKDFNLFWKWLLTLAILGITILCVVGAWEVVKKIMDEFRQLGLL